MNLTNKKYLLKKENNTAYRYTIELYFPVIVKIYDDLAPMYNLVSNMGEWPTRKRNWYDEKLEECIRIMISDLRASSKL